MIDGGVAIERGAARPPRGAAAGVGTASRASALAGQPDGFLLPDRDAHSLPVGCVGRVFRLGLVRGGGWHQALL